MKYSFFSILFLSLLSFISCSKDEEYTRSISVTGDQDEDSTSATIDDNYRYQIPVIFHVLYADERDTNQYVAYNRIKEILQNVNDIWKGNKYYTAIYGPGLDMGVDFVLASTDEDGNKLSQPGVEYIKYTGDYPIDPETFMSAKGNKKYMWEPNEFINIMLYNFKEESDNSGTLLGISNLPYTHNGAHMVEGLTTTNKTSLSKGNLGFCYCSSINSLYQSRRCEGTRYSYYNNKNNSLYYMATDINSTIAHELGHYLGLYHVFAEDHSTESVTDMSSSDDTDYCDDTESYNYVTYKDTLDMLTLMKRGYSMVEASLKYDGNRHKHFTAANIMDYWACYSNRFTTEQRERVRNVLYYSPLIPGPKLPVSNATQAKGIGYSNNDELLPNAKIIR